MYVIEQPLPVAPATDSQAQVLSQWNAVYDAYNEVACLILGADKKSLQAKGKAKDEHLPPLQGGGSLEGSCPVYLAELLKKKKQVLCQFLKYLTIEYICIQNDNGCEEYPKETMVTNFYFPPENKIDVARSKRTHRTPDRLCLNVEVKEHSLGDLNEPTSYKSAMLDSESNKWIEAMNAEYHPMMDNMVWSFDLPPGGKTVRASGGNVTFLILYVDDIIIMGNHIPSLQSVNDYLGKCFAMKDLGEAAFILRIKAIDWTWSKCLHG
ncbi:hypothetical protein Tco_0613323 [Tanacetum coccineum]